MQTEGEGLILSSADGATLCTLNPAEAYVWKACEEGLTAAEMMAELGQLFPGSVDEVERFVRDMLADFQEDGLLEADGWEAT